jgi:NAD(P)-dependent dehydrogenase (short-subunit alcohol dehydrogenase family)
MQSLQNLLWLLLLSVTCCRALVTMAASARLPVVVTGANAGIGLAIVKNLVARPEGYHVFLCCRNPAKGAEALSSVPSGPGSAEVLQLDVTNSKDIAAAAEAIASKCPVGVHALVNNAGVGIDLPFLNANTDPATARNTLAPNYYGALAVTEALLPQLRQGGRIVNISSGTCYLRVNVSCLPLVSV